VPLVFRPARTASILAHLGEVALPQPLPEEAWEALDFADAKNFGEGQIHRRRIGLKSERPSRFLQELRIEHKICAFHVHSITDWHP
jgi:hypothetical protein